ncbi:MAG TPA: hypothetical protein PK303_06920 [bacterium]|nr:hypothetical protein [bacterium]HOL35292.1 hypothetical protein [bacterium]HPP08833.1 hypothetical protein [bacterium]
MVNFRQLKNEAMIKLSFDKSIICGAKISYSLDGKIYLPCAIFLDNSADVLLDSTFWEWNQAVQFGNIRFRNKVHPVYWNLYLNELHNYLGNIKTRVEILDESGTINTFEKTLAIEPSCAIFINDWGKFLNDDGWKITDGCLTFVPQKGPSTIFIRPQISGKFQVYFGLKYGIIHMKVGISDEKVRYPFIAERTRPEFQNKYHKEIFWKTVNFSSDTAIEISPTPMTVRQPDQYPFGSMAYIKLVPVFRKDYLKTSSRWNDKSLALYFEPYSWAFYYDLDTSEKVKEAMILFKEMGATEVHTQVIRFGSKALHHSRVVERHDKGAMMGDDGTFSPGPAAMVRALDILKETNDVCHYLGISHFANAGLTNCYPGTDLEEKISRQHPEWRTANILRFNVPETRRYVVEVLKEFVEWGNDGISIDCMRYPYYHTEEDLLNLFHEIRRAMDKISNTKIPLTVRIPAEDIVYYRVFEQLARKNIVQCVIPSNLLTRYPIFSLKPYLKWKDYGCKIYGIIDGWLIHMASYLNFQLSLYRFPSDIKNDIKRFFNEGADGVFVYQADLYCADPFTRDVLNWKQWKKK